MIVEKAMGKINLCLDITSRRSDGYHNVESIMHTVPIWDTVYISESENITITCTNENVPTGNTNLAHKAAELFFGKTEIKSGAKIHIDKKIPVAAGMAGGSSDAAATLRGLNKIYGKPLSQSELENIGASLGADVPFCIRGGTEGVTGIGYNFVKVAPPPKFIYVIACGGEGISTPQMYGEYDKRYSPPVSDETKNYFTGKAENLRIALEEGKKERIFSCMFNCFEEIAEEKRHHIKIIKDIMKVNGAVFTMMSGSGPSVFGIFESFEKAKLAEDRIIKIGASAFAIIDE